MTDERLYIDGQLVDIGNDTKITMNIKSNLFRDVSKIAANNTYTIKLPKTVRNQMIFQHSDLVQSKDGFAYKMHTARYFRNGVEIIKNGRASVLKVSDDAIEVSIFWGIFTNFATLASAGTTLNQLESKDRLLYNRRNEVNTYSEALNKNYFYACYDVWTHDVNIDYTWRGGQGMIYPRIEEQIYTDSRFGGSYGSGSDSGVENLHPVVKVSYLLNLIKEQKGVELQFSKSDKEYIDTLIIPLIAKKSNELTFDSSFKADFLFTTKNTPLLRITEDSNVFADKAGTNVSYLKAKSDATVIFDIAGEWELDIKNYRPTGRTSSVINGRSVAYDNYNFLYGYWIKMTVSNGTEAQEYAIGNNQLLFKVDVPTGYKGKVRFKYSGYGKVEVKAGAKITFEVVTGDAGLPKWLNSAFGINRDVVSFLGGTLNATLQSDDNVPSGGYFPIAENLPKIKITDFFKFLIAITGSFPLQVSQDGVIKVVPLSTIWNNRNKAVDWTRRIIAQRAENKPKDIEFAVDGYGRRSLYKWKDDNVVGNYDGVLQIDNETIEKEKTIFEFPFAATNGNNVPMYTEAEKAKVANISGDGGNTQTAEQKPPTYKACKDRILRLKEDKDGKAFAWFDIDMQKIIDEKYRYLSDSLQRAKIVTESVRIRDIELVNFDETKPIYLAQYGSYFAVLEIKANGDGIAEVTMLQIYFN